MGRVRRQDNGSHWKRCKFSRGRNGIIFMTASARREMTCVHRKALCCAPLAKLDSLQK
jgi:hypothetical protein